MDLIEACIMNAEIAEGELEKRLSSLYQMGVHHLIFSDFLGLSRFSREILQFDAPICCLNVVCRPKVEWIEMLWDTITHYDSFSIFITYSDAHDDEAFEDAIYHCFSLTDNVGCAIETGTISSTAFDDMVRRLQGEVEVKDFLILDNNGLLMPKETLGCLKALRSKVGADSRILYFPNNKQKLGIINALHVMRSGINGLVGSALKETCEDTKIISFLDLFRLYQHERDNLFTERASKLADHVFWPIMRKMDTG